MNIVLVNFRVKPHVARRLLPPGYEPKLVAGRVIASISLVVGNGEDGIDLTLRSFDGEIAVELVAEATHSLPPASRFHSLAEASAFFAAGSLGYSPGADTHRLDALVLPTSGWLVEPLTVTHVFSSFFADERLFPEGSVEFDSALLMQNLDHGWQGISAQVLPTARERHGARGDTEVKVVIPGGSGQAGTIRAGAFRDAEHSGRWRARVVFTDERRAP